MQQLLSLLPAEDSPACKAERLLACSRGGALRLSPAQALALAEAHGQALAACHRVEFGPPATERLIALFGDSPCIAPDEYADVLAELTRMFYHYKNQLGRAYSDEELAGEMHRLFHGPCRGSLELLAGRELEALVRRARGIPPEEDAGEEEDAYGNKHAE